MARMRRKCMFPQGFMFLYSGNMETALVSGGASYKK